MKRVLATACVTVLAIVLAAVPARAADMVMKASWYGGKYDGRPMKGGGIFRKDDPTIVAAASGSFRFGTRLRLTNPRNGRTLDVVVRDRGRFPSNHIDLSQAGDRALGFKEAGVAWLHVSTIPE